ncbi:MAG TPA: Nif3-like dinuclear metal center hexameric protein [Burkholderiaceae bacterium]|nr:Nif3-like dinuclear metal center hexameric protein [Burkholderiaceae bacterium]
MQHDEPESAEAAALTAIAAGRGAVGRAELAEHLDAVLEARQFRDYCPNGLQIEGAERIERLVCGVTASAALIRAAIARGAHALLVHHGYFWRGEDPRLTGTRRERIALLLRHDINLFAFHLPLDVHPQLGNNAQLAQRMGWRVDLRGGDDELVCLHALDAPLAASELAERLQARLGRAPLLVGPLQRPIRRIAWCTGAAQDLLQQAIDLGADAFVSGEISERTTHLAREAGVVYAAAGHHATERYGVQALAARVAQRFDLHAEFIDDPNPV